jgi:hypothetical protein
MKKNNTEKGDEGSADLENPEWTRVDFARAVPLSGLRLELPVSIRLSPEVVKPSMKMFYKPHEGRNFIRGSARKPGGLLILSESAYAWDEDGGGCPGPDHPSEHSINLWALSDRFDNRGNQGRYIAWLTKALCHQQRPTVKQREAAWSGIAYSIYVQRPMETLSMKPTLLDFENSGGPFLELVENLHPGKVLITSIASWKNMPFTQENHPTDKSDKYGGYRLSDQSLVWCLAVPHQRARRMGWERLGECIANFSKEKLPVR